MPNMLNIGSGQRPFKEPWLNVDCQERWKPDIVADGASLPMFDDGSQDMICLHHVLEHYGCGEAKGLLTECYRLLKPRGSLLIFVPNMWELTHMWRTGQLTDQLFMTNVYGAYMQDEADRHRWGYSAASLKEFVESVGFRYSCFNWRQIPGADIARDTWILGVEAIK